MFEMIHLLVETVKCNELFNESFYKARKKTEKRESRREMKKKQRRWCIGRM